MTSLPAVTALPDPPSREDDSDTFVQKADAFVAALITMVSEFNAALQAIPLIASAINYNTTSSTSLAVGAGTKTFAIPTGGLLQVGQFVIAASASAPSNYMAGQVTSHNTLTGTLVLSIGTTGGSGTYSDWVIAVTVADVLQPVSALAISASGADLVDATVTFAKFQNSSGASKLFGRGAGSGAGVFQEISLGSNISMSGTTLNVSTGTASLGDGDYGDIVASGSGTVLTIDAGVVTYAKMQATSGTDKLLGRATAGGGVIEEITCTAAGRALLDDADATAQRATLGLGSISVFNEATVAEFRANTASKALSTDKVWSAADYVTLTQATTIAVDMALGLNFTTTMTGNRTLGAPTNTKNGQCGVIEVIQDTTGGRTLAYNSVWKFASGTAPVLSTAANARDLLFYQVFSSTRIYGTLIKDVK
jgi:hypothetical protein